MFTKWFICEQSQS